MTFIAIHCPKCRKRFRAKLQQDSRTEICPNCQTTIVIPSSKDAQTQSVDTPQVLEQPVEKSFPDAPPVPTTNYGDFGQQPSGKRVRSSAYAGHETKRKFLATGLWLQFVGLSIATIGFPLFVGAVALADLANRNGDALQKALGLIYVGGILLFGIGVFVSLAIPVARSCTIWVSVTVATAIVSVFMIYFGIAIASVRPINV